MKKTLIIIATVFGFSMGSYALPKETLNSNNNVVVMPKNVINPFCMSIVKGDYDTVKRLVELGQDVNLKSNGMTPAMYAAKYNRVDILKLLVENGADLKKRCHKGKTAAYYAKLSNAKEALAFINEQIASKKSKRK